MTGRNFSLLGIAFGIRRSNSTFGCRSSAQTGIVRTLNKHSILLYFDILISLCILVVRRR